MCAYISAKMVTLDQIVALTVIGLFWATGQPTTPGLNVFFGIVSLISLSDFHEGYLCKRHSWTLERVNIHLL